MAEVPVTREQMQAALETAEGWAEHGYTEGSKAYWAGMRDALRVMLGVTTESPTMTGPGADLAANELLRPITEPRPLPEGWTAWWWLDGKTTYGKSCDACGTSYDACTRKLLARPSSKPCCGSCGYTQTHAETEKRPIA